MGYYLNPVGSKESWLGTHGARRTADDCRLAYSKPELGVPVVLVDNGYGSFSAAGIAYCRDEFEDFMRPDGRHKTLYLVPRDKIIAECPSVAGALF